MDYKEVIDNIYNEVKPLFGQGKVADYTLPWQISTRVNTGLP